LSNSINISVDAEVLKAQIAANSKKIDQYIEELKEINKRLTEQK